MAFTEGQRLKVRIYLGIPSINRYRDPRLEGALDVVGADADAAAEVVSILATLAALEAKVTAALTTAGLKRADEVEWYEGANKAGAATLDAIRNEGRRWSSRLSQLLGVPIVGDAWGRAGYGGDWFFGPAAQQSGGVTPLG